MNNKENIQDFKHSKEDKMYNFSISAEKDPYRRNTPTPGKKEIKYSASGAKIYKEDMVEPLLNNNLFSQDLGEDENDKSPFSFLKKTNPAIAMIQNNKNFVPKVLNYEKKKGQNSASNS
mmetsp:Transcript_5206/g.5972  ORF Transcript_5206/g.5972 Transcript_5206/m.5972 type:complete len:119 (-) Transcript_5206:248-604(-)